MADKSKVMSLKNSLKMSFRHFITTLLMGAIVMGVLSSAHARDREPVPPSVEAQYFVNAVRLKERLLADYREVVAAYYELKKKSASPDTFPNPLYSLELAANTSLAEDARARVSNPTVKSLFEFSHAAYLEFQDELDRDPKLRGNTYIRRMKEYGHGQANDIFQRIGTYAQEPFSELRRGHLLTLYMEIGNPVMAVGMVESHEIFLEESKKAGYEQNGNPAAQTKKAEWAAVVEKKAMDLEHEIRELGYDPKDVGGRPKSLGKSRASKTRANRLAAGGGGGPSSCATAFRSISE